MLKQKKNTKIFKNISKIPPKVINKNFTYVKKDKFSQYKEFSHLILLWNVWKVIN